MDLRAVILLALATHAATFKFLSDFKAASLIPRPSAMLKKRKAANVYGNKKLAVITGASSGLGLKTTAELLRTGEYHVFGAVRDMEKMRLVAEDEGISLESFTPLHVDLNSFASVREFCDELNKVKLNRQIDRLICNAAVYQPGDVAQWSADSHPQTMQVNVLSHFLMISLLISDMSKAANPQVIFVGGASMEDSVAVYPRADLGNLDGLKAGLKCPISMPDGYNYHGAKAYKDSKLCLSMLSNLLHKRYHKQTGIAFSTVHPGVIAESRLLQGKPPLDTSPIGQLREAIGMGEVRTVTTSEAASRLFQVAYDARCAKSGVNWSWLEGEAAEAATKATEDEAGGAASGSRAGWETVYEKEPSNLVTDFEISQHLWTLASEVTGASWPPAYQPRSPCPTLVVIGAITKANNAKQDAKRKLEGLEPGPGGVGVKVLGGTGKAIDAVASTTIGRAAKLAQDKLLGGMVDAALEGSFQEEVVEKRPSKWGQQERDDHSADKVENTLLAVDLQKRIDQLAKSTPL